MMSTFTLFTCLVIVIIPDLEWETEVETFLSAASIKLVRLECPPVDVDIICMVLQGQQAIIIRYI